MKKCFKVGVEDLPSSEPAIVRSPELADDGLAQTKANPDLAFVGDAGVSVRRLAQTPSTGCCS